MTFEATTQLKSVLSPKDDFTFMSNEKWQQRLLLLKAVNVPTTAKKLNCKFTKDPLLNGKYHGDTTNMYYQNYINDCIKELRAGRTTYAFYVYQIKELLRFFPNMEARLDEGILSCTLPNKNQYIKQKI